MPRQIDEIKKDAIYVIASFFVGKLKFFMRVYLVFFKEKRNTPNAG